MIIKKRKKEKAKVAIFISDKIDFKVKIEKNHYIIIKGSIHQEDITIVNIYAPNIRTPKYIKQELTELKGKINCNTIIVGDFNTPLSTMNRSSRQRIKKETVILKNIITEMKLTDIYRTFYPSAVEYTFSQVLMEHLLGYTIC